MSDIEFKAKEKAGELFEDLMSGGVDTFTIQKYFMEYEQQLAEATANTASVKADGIKEAMFYAVGMADGNKLTFKQHSYFLIEYAKSLEGRKGLDKFLLSENDIDKFMQEADEDKT